MTHDDDDTREPVEMHPESGLCLYPFFNLMTVASGKYKPCCKYQGELSDRGRTLQAPEAGLDDAWRSDSLAKLRRDFRAGKKPEGCRVCWTEEAQGISSMRFDSFHYGVDASQVLDPQAPSRLDLYPSNLCNLRCRICSPEYSSRWIPEARETLGIEEELHLNLNEANLAVVERWLPRITELGLFGGEPLYLKETHALLERCVEEGHHERIALLINTNGTIYSKALAERLARFRKVWLNFSIDDIGARFEYQRSGAEWEPTVDNIRHYLEHGGYREDDRIEVKICCTVSMLNIYYLPEYLEWLGTTFPGMKVFLNLLHGPFTLSACNLPPAAKERVAERLDTIPVDQLCFDTRSIADVRAFLLGEPNLDFARCLAEIQRGDAYRNEAFHQVFPEFWELIQDCGPARHR